MADGEAMDASFEAAMVGSCKLKRIAETPRASVVGEAEPATGSASEGGGKEAEYARTERLEDHRLTAEGRAIRSGTGAAALKSAVLCQAELIRHLNALLIMSAPMQSLTPCRAPYRVRKRRRAAVQDVRVRVGLTVRQDGRLG
ncbi:hypothetical protein GQ600_21633 [Phytophthora cactorum]|nr:hypothetical protein GQ600_21633 [Phytophthora cactorum]